MRTCKRSLPFAILAAVLLLLAAIPVDQGFAQDSKQQPIPDAPSATRPFPKPTISPTAPPAEPSAAPDNPTPADNPDAAQPTPAPPPNITTAPPGTAPREGNTNSRDELFKLVVNANYVNVPVTVKDDKGHLVAGLLPPDFAILEDGQAQRIAFFTSDPFPLSASVVLDLGMSDTAVAKVRDTLPALIGAFGQFDEVSLYTYGNTVTRMQGFAPAQNDVVIQAVRKLQKSVTGRTGGAPVVGGPFGSGPSVNGHPVDPGAQATVNAQQNPTGYRPESHVLNDAILTAALDLAQRDRTRRKVLFVISNGRELGSDASYNEVLKVLQTNGISVYGIGLDEAALPGYRQLQKIRIPGNGYGDILPKYASATGGQVFTELSRDAIESAYTQVTQEARNQYTIGYNTRQKVSSTYRSIEVRVHRPGMKVIARDGYYPLPPPR